MKLQAYFANRLNLVIFCGVSAVSLLAAFCSEHSSEKKTQEPALTEVSTFIPAGHVLVPITLVNLESIQAMVENYSLVDLYTPSVNGKRGRRVGTHLKLIRAPLNPNMFGVLIPREEVATIVSEADSFFAVIKNPELERGSARVDSLNKTYTVEYYK